MNPSYIVVLFGRTFNFIGSGYTIVGTQNKAYHWSTPEEARQHAEHFCQEVHEVNPHTQETTPFDYLVVKV